MNKFKFAAGTLISTGLVFGLAATSEATQPSPPNQDHKVTICHTSKGNNPHEIEVDYKGALGHSKTDPLDIIPTFPGFEGQNLDKENPCLFTLPVPTTETTTTLAPTTVTTVASTVTTAGPPTTLPTTSVPVTSPTTTLPAPSTTSKTEETTTWITTSSTKAPTTTLPSPSTTGTTKPALSTSTVTTLIAPVTTEPSSTQTTLPPTTQSLTPGSPSISSLPVTGSNSFLLSVLAGAMITLGAMILMKGRKR